MLGLIIQVAIVLFILAKIDKHVPGARRLFLAFPGIISAAFATLWIVTRGDSGALKPFWLIWSLFFFIIFYKEFFFFPFSLLTGRWKRWVIIDAIAALCMFFGAFSSDFFAPLKLSDIFGHAKIDAGIYWRLIVPFLFATLAFEGSKHLTSKFYFTVEKNKISIRVFLVILYVSLGAGVHFLLSYAALL